MHRWCELVCVCVAVLCAVVLEHSYILYRAMDLSSASALNTAHTRSPVQEQPTSHGLPLQGMYYEGMPPNVRQAP